MSILIQLSEVHGARRVKIKIKTDTTTANVIVLVI